MAPNAQRSFESILDTPSEEVKRPVPLPVGTYDTIIQGLYEEGESSKKKTPFVKFTHKIIAAGDDVDTDELEEMGGIADKTIKNTYYTTPDSLFRLTDFLDILGIEGGERTIRQRLGETPNCACKIVVEHRPSEDGASFFAEVKRVLKAD